MRGSRKAFRLNLLPEPKMTLYRKDVVSLEDWHILAASFRRKSFCKDEQLWMTRNNGKRSRVAAITEIAQIIVARTEEDAEAINQRFIETANLYFEISEGALGLRD